MMTPEQLNDYIKLLKNAVKYSHLDRQKHIDLSVTMASERPRYEEALMQLRLAVRDGLLSEEDLKKKLGLL
jgi:hypothetical protein